MLALYLLTPCRGGICFIALFVFEALFWKRLGRETRFVRAALNRETVEFFHMEPAESTGGKQRRLPASGCARSPVAPA